MLPRDKAIISALSGPNQANQPPSAPAAVPLHLPPLSCSRVRSSFGLLSHEDLVQPANPLWIPTKESIASVDPSCSTYRARPRPGALSSERSQKRIKISTDPCHRVGCSLVNHYLPSARTLPAKSNFNSSTLRLPVLSPLCGCLQRSVAMILTGLRRRSLYIVLCIRLICVLRYSVFLWNRRHY